MEIKLREKWVAGFASVGKEKKNTPPIQSISSAELKSNLSSLWF